MRTARMSAGGGVYGMGPSGWVWSWGSTALEGVWSRGSYGPNGMALPPRQNDGRLWKHYLPATS